MEKKFNRYYLCTVDLITGVRHCKIFRAQINSIDILSNCVFITFVEPNGNTQPAVSALDGFYLRHILCGVKPQNCMYQSRPYIFSK